MKNSMKKIIFLMTVIVCSISSVQAFDINTIHVDEENIIQPYWANENSTITVYSDILDASSKVYFNQVVLTEEQYTLLSLKLEVLNEYSESQNEVIKGKKEELNTLRSQLNTLFDEAYKEGASEEAKQKYTEAKENYDIKVNEYNALVDAFNEEYQNKKNEYYKLVPNFDNETWKQLQVKTVEDHRTLYAVNMNEKKASLYLSWVKVETSGNTYYSLALYHDTSYDKDEEEITPPTTDDSDTTDDKDDTTLPPIEKPSDDKETTVENPKTGFITKSTLVIGFVVISTIGIWYFRKKNLFSKI